VLLHSPSGAGKTSLIQAAVVPAFKDDRGFGICAAASPHGLSAQRVNLPPPLDVEVPNRYVFSVVNGMVGHLVERHEALGMRIKDACELFEQKSAEATGGAERQLLVLDQLEEVLTLDPGDVKGRKEFFRQLGEALDHPRRWCLLATMQQLTSVVTVVLALSLLLNVVLVLQLLR
jgi:hypothetical protein